MPLLVYESFYRNLPVSKYNQTEQTYGPNELHDVAYYNRMKFAKIDEQYDIDSPDDFIWFAKDHYGELGREFRMPAAGPTTCMKVSTGLSSCPEPRKNVPGGNSLRGRFWIRDRQRLTGGVPWRPPAVPRPAAAWHTRRAGTGHAPTVPFYSKSSARCTRRRRRPPRTGRSPARAGRRPGRGWAGEEGPAGRAKAEPCRRRRRG